MYSYKTYHYIIDIHISVCVWGGNLMHLSIKACFEIFTSYHDFSLAKLPCWKRLYILSELRSLESQENIEEMFIYLNTRYCACKIVV